MIDFNRVLSIVEAFNREGVEYKVCGGVAMNFHGLPRTTEDVDFFVAPSPENLARIKRALRSIWDDPDLDEIQDDDMIGDYPNFTYEPPDEPFGIDLLSRLGEAFTYDDLEAQTLEIRGVPVRFVTAETLYRMKYDTVRPIDKIDAMRLRKKFGLKDK
ncbi:MAG TPA: nucleotidyl transferase AbiEii/AbiGii toxin family protein [Thermoanaerobaculia bacterium]